MTTGDITTIGRGGSDTTAVALAVALRADECQILTDVDGVYTTDPRMVPQARRLERVTFDEMLELAGQGSRVLHLRSVEFASKYNVPLRVASSFAPGPGTLICREEPRVEAPLVSGIAFNRDEAEITIAGVPDTPGTAHRLLRPVSDANIEVDMIVLNAAREGRVDLTFTVHRDDYAAACKLVRTAAAEAAGRRQRERQREGCETLRSRRRHALARGRGDATVRDAGARADQRAPGLDLGDQDLRAGR